jgi:hypothetical protein
MSGKRVKPEEWKLEDWIEFKEIIDEEQGLVTSLREAERALRKLCASGVIQTMYVTEDGPKFIPRNEWKRADFDTYRVYLSTKDLSRHWLELQNKPVPEAGKQPRIRAHLAEMFPNGVPDPAHCPRKTLKADLLRRDPSLNPLDEATLKSAIDAYNSSLG